jgi:hypothetical protein
LEDSRIWSIKVSAETDRALRKFLLECDNHKRGSMSRTVEEAVNAYIGAKKGKDKNAKKTS